MFRIFRGTIDVRTDHRSTPGLSGDVKRGKFKHH